MDYLSFKVGNTPVPLNGQIGSVEFKGTGAGQYAFGGYIIGKIITIIVLFAVLTSVVTIIIGGWKWIRSQGEPKRIEEARQTIIYAFVGMLVAFLSFFIIRYIFTFFNVKIF